MTDQERLNLIRAFVATKDADILNRLKDDMAPDVMKAIGEIQGMRQQAERFFGEGWDVFANLLRKNVIRFTGRKSPAAYVKELARDRWHRSLVSTFIAKGDQRAFTELQRDLHREILNLVAWKGRANYLSDDDAKDISQDVFIVFWKKLYHPSRPFDPNGTAAVKTYLFAISKVKIFEITAGVPIQPPLPDNNNEHDPDDEPEDTRPSPEELAERKEHIGAIEEKLTEEEFYVVMMKDYFGHTHQEIADRYGKRLDIVYRIYNRAVGKLRKDYPDNGDAHK